MNDRETLEQLARELGIRPEVMHRCRVRQVVHERRIVVCQARSQMRWSVARIARAMEVIEWTVRRMLRAGK